MSTTQLIRRKESCTSHPAGAGRDGATLAAPARPESVPLMRGFARDAGRAWGIGDDAVDALSLIISELVANACQHSGSAEVAVRLFADPDRVVAQVSDRGSWKPVAHSLPDDEATSGRGLQLVRAFAEEVHVARTCHGTDVTATVATEHRPTARK
jgi:anti-sigma regulatory factor (Ser/Thr protein kinase)